MSTENRALNANYYSAFSGRQAESAFGSTHHHDAGRKVCFDTQDCGMTIWDLVTRSKSKYVGHVFETLRPDSKQCVRIRHD